MKRLHIGVLTILLTALPLVTHATPVEWTPLDAWLENALTGSIGYKDGSIAITVSGENLTTLGQVVNPFATVSERYSNIDVATHHVLRVFPSEPSTPWSIEFDLIGTTLTAADVFTIGQLAVSSAGAQLTTMTVAMFAADDVTPIDLTTLAFEQHALISPNFDALLDWDPATGALAPIPEGISKNSGWGFYGPADVTVGRIVVTAAATGGPDAINFSFGIPLSEPPETVPEPASAALLLIGAAGLAVRRRRRSAKR